MKATVKILRSNGERRSDRDIAADQGLVGTLRLAIVDKVACLNLSDANDQQFKPLIPVLYHARMVALHGETMMFQGLTARREDAGQPQEWSIRIAP